MSCSEWVCRADRRGKCHAGADWIEDFRVNIGLKVVSHDRYVMFQLAEVAVPRRLFAEILSLIARLRAPPVLA